MSVPQKKLRASQKNFAVWLTLLLVFSAVHVIGLLFQVGGETLATLRGDLLNIPPSLIAAWIIYLVSKHHNDALKKMWFWLAISLLTLGIGDCIWAYLEIVLKIDPFPSVADIFYVLQPIGLIVAFSFIPRKKLQTKREGLKLNLEIGIVMTALMILAWRIYLADTILEYDQQYLALILSLIYPVMDVLQLISLSLLMFNGRGNLTKFQFSSLALGLTGMSLFDILFNIQEASNSYQTANPLDLLVMICAVFFCLAAVSSLQPKNNLVINARFANNSKKEMGSNWRTLALVTQVCVFVVFLVNVFRKNDSSINDIGVLTGTGLAVVLALFRQSIELYDNSELNKNLRTLSNDLEQRVIERTEELNTKTVLLQESQAQLVASEKLASLGRITASVAHEVNTPLAASLYDLSHARELVREYKNSLLSPNVTKDDHLEIASELESVHQRIERSLERLGRFIRRVREQSRMSSKDSFDFDARQTLQDCFVHLEYQAFEHQVKLEISLPDEAILVHGDPLRLKQILNELVLTSIQACRGQPDQNLSWVRIVLDSSDKTVRLSVENNGLPLDVDVLTSIFEPKFSMLSEDSDGLGLSVVHDIVKGHFSGDIGVNSHVGIGTRFDISIPKAGSVKETV